jgi:hypothetical protein
MTWPEGLTEAACLQGKAGGLGVGLDQVEVCYIRVVFQNMEEETFCPRGGTLQMYCFDVLRYRHHNQRI